MQRVVQQQQQQQQQQQRATPKNARAPSFSKTRMRESKESQPCRDNYEHG
jgi:hypothetical protein